MSAQSLSIVLWSCFSLIAFADCDEYLDAFERAAKAVELDPATLEAQIRTENSTCDQSAVSAANARGCGQLLDSTANEVIQKYSLDWSNSTCIESIFLASIYLREQYNYFLPRVKDETEAMVFALAAYNRGRGGVLRTAARIGKGLIWSVVRDNLPTETINYTRKIFRKKKSIAIR